MGRSRAPALPRAALPVRPRSSGDPASAPLLTSSVPAPVRPSVRPQRRRELPARSRLGVREMPRSAQDRSRASARRAPGSARAVARPAPPELCAAPPRARRGEARRGERPPPWAGLSQNQPARPPARREAASAAAGRPAAGGGAAWAGPAPDSAARGRRARGALGPDTPRPGHPGPAPRWSPAPPPTTPSREPPAGPGLGVGEPVMGVGGREPALSLAILETEAHSAQGLDQGHPL
uniref:translation initiation factor IF-2-like n=1 Tax=Jaculus jaculus TaxID=51337 RepID=UPI001E1B3692|nr:translation initiation factor IF-2-like [Jaculus jaculus]